MKYTKRVAWCEKLLTDYVYLLPPRPGVYLPVTYIR